MSWLISRTRSSAGPSPPTPPDPGAGFALLAEQAIRRYPATSAAPARGTLASVVSVARSRRWRAQGDPVRRSKIIFPAIPLALALAACGSSNDSSNPTVTGAPATGPEPSPTPSAEPLMAECSSEAVAPVVNAEINPDGSIPAVAELAECRGGYARAFLVPEDTAAYETEQLFLVDVDGEWQVLTFGTGIDCVNDIEFRPAELEDACVALGLR